MSEIDTGIVDKVAAVMWEAWQPAFPFEMQPAYIKDKLREQARAAIAAYEEAKAAISPQDAFDLLNRLETARLERVEATWALGT
jgi:hypothetical protein